MASVSEFVLNYVLNATWQIVAITTIAALGSLLLRNVPARYRHVLWLTALGSCLVVPLLTTTHAIPANQSAFITAPSTETPQVVSTPLKPEPDLSLPHLTKRRTRIVNTASLPTLWLGFAQKLITPKAFANSSPGLFQPWENISVDISTLKAFANSFGVEYFRWLRYPGYKPWAEISELRWSSTQNVSCSTFCAKLYGLTLAYALFLAWRVIRLIRFWLRRGSRAARYTTRSRAGCAALPHDFWD